MYQHFPYNTAEGRPRRARGGLCYAKENPPTATFKPPSSYADGSKPPGPWKKPSQKIGSGFLGAQPLGAANCSVERNSIP